MLETYKVGVTIEMGGNAQAGIDRFIAQMERLDRLTKDAGSTFTKLAESVRVLGMAGRSVDALSRAMQRLSAGDGRGAADFERMAAAARSMTTASERLTTVLRENARLSADMARSAEAAARTGGGGRGGGGGRSGGHSGGFGGHDWALTGMGASMVGDPLLRGGQSAFERGMEVGHLRTQILSDSRVSPTQADSMVDRAYAATASAPGTRVTENLHSLIDLKQVTGSLEEAEALLPRFAQLSAMLQVVDRRKGGTGDSAFAAAKAMELLGGMVEERQVNGHTERDINPELLQKRLDMIARVAVATNGRVAPQDYLGFAKQARVAGMMLSDEFIYEKLPALMLAMGGVRAGTALMSAAQVFEGGKLTAKSMQAMQEIGLAGPGGITMEGQRRNKKGEMIGGHAVVHSDAIYDLAMLRTDPASWTESAQKRMEAAGIHGTDNQITALMKASQRAPIAGMLADLLKDAVVIAKEQANIRATRPDVGSFIAQNDPAAKLQQMQAAFDRLLTTFGSSAMNDAVRLMSAVTGGLNDLSAWAKEHPTMARVLTDTAVGLGAIATALGTLSTAIFVFGPALRLLGIGGAAAAGGGGWLGAASRVALGAGAGTAGAAAVGVGGAIYLGGTTDPVAAEQQLQKLAKQRRADPMMSAPMGDGFGTDGRPIQLRGDIHIDGRRMGEFSADSAARSLSGPRRGPTGDNVASNPWMIPGGY